MRLATGARLSSAIRALAKRRRSLSFNVGLTQGEESEKDEEHKGERERENTKKPLSNRPISATSIYQRRAALDRARGIRCVSDGSSRSRREANNHRRSLVSRAPRITITRVRMWPRGFVGIRATELRLKLVGH